MQTRARLSASTMCPSALQEGPWHPGTPQPHRTSLSALHTPSWATGDPGGWLPWTRGAPAGPLPRLVQPQRMSSCLLPTDSLSRQAWVTQSHTAGVSGSQSQPCTLASALSQAWKFLGGIICLPVSMHFSLYPALGGSSFLKFISLGALSFSAHLFVCSCEAIPDPDPGIYNKNRTFGLCPFSGTELVKSLQFPK